MVQEYVSLIRPILAYGCQLWHGGLNDNQQALLELIQERALSFLSYDNALLHANLPTLHHCRDELCRRKLHDAQGPNHKLHPLLPPEKNFCLQSQLISPHCQRFALIDLKTPL